MTIYNWCAVRPSRTQEFCPGIPTAEEEVLKTFQCGFDSHSGHMTYIGMKVQNVPFDGHFTIRYLGKRPLTPNKIKDLKELLEAYENLRFTVHHGSLDWFGPNKDVPVVSVYGSIMTLLTAKLNRALTVKGFVNEGYPFTPHITIPKIDYPLPKKFILGPVYIKNGSDPRIYLGA